MPHSTEARDQIFVKGYEILSFAEKSGEKCR